MGEGSESIARDRPAETRSAGIRWGRIAVLACGAVVLYLLGHALADMVVERFGLELRSHNEPMIQKAIMTATAVYVVLMAIPFMPAAEIGLTLLMIFGGHVSLLVYTSTVAALTLAYLIGRLLPAELGARALGAVGLVRARNFVNRLVPLSPDERLAILMHETPTKLAPYLVRHRFVALAVLFMLPGNIVIGGGGGIALVAGMTRLFPMPAYLLTVALAVAPVPLFIYLMP